MIKTFKSTNITDITFNDSLMKSLLSSLKIGKTAYKVSAKKSLFKKKGPIKIIKDASSESDEELNYAPDFTDEEEFSLVNRVQPKYAN